MTKRKSYITLIRSHLKVKGPVKVHVIHGSNAAPSFHGVKGHSVDSRDGTETVLDTPREFVMWIKSTYHIQVGAVWVMENLPEAWLDICRLVLRGGGNWVFGGPRL